MEKEKVIKALECCSTPSGKRCENCPKVTEDALCMYRLSGDALALIKELTEDNEAQAETIKSLIETIKDVKADTVREIFKEIYSSLDYIEEQMEPEEIPECFFSVREDIDALKEKFERGGAAGEI